MSLADTTTKSKIERCWIGGGTFSEHALSMRAGVATLRYLKNKRRALYSSLARIGENMRSGIDEVFAKHGIRTQTTGAGSLFATHFLKSEQKIIKTPEDVNASDSKTERDFDFALIANSGIFYLPGHIGAISSKHTKSDIEYFLTASESYANRMRAK